MLLIEHVPNFDLKLCNFLHSFVDVPPVDVAMMWTASPQRSGFSVDVRRVPFEKLAGLAGSESYSVIRKRVEAAGFKEWSKLHVLVNGDMGPASPLSSSGESNN